MHEHPFEPRLAEPFLLIVDDEPSVLEVTHAMAAALGWHPLLANTAEHALTLFRLHPGTLHHVLVDLHMPGCGGEALARALRALRPDVHVDVMTGDETGADVLLASGVVDGVLVNPFVLADLEQALLSPVRAA